MFKRFTKYLAVTIAIGCGYQACAEFREMHHKEWYAYCTAKNGPNYANLGRIHCSEVYSAIFAQRCVSGNAPEWVDCGWATWGRNIQGSARYFSMINR
jgi:hypothetical protein